MLGWDWYGFLKKCAETCFADLLFLHPIGSMGHIVHSEAFRARNVNALFFILRWDRYRFNKKRVRTHYAKIVILHPVGSAGHVVHNVSSRA
jgi:hypothetical protein